MGEARLTAPGAITVATSKGEEEIAAAAVILATGARARELPGMEADGERVWTYRHALAPPHMPKKLLVVGSGAIGIEFASFYATLGAETTVVEVLDRILPVEDAEISGLARKAFEKQGMRILEGATVKALDRSADAVKATIEQGGKSTQETFDTVISAVGIVGNVEGLGLEALGVKLDRSHVVVDEFCRTGIDGLYAIGDVAGPPWLAHKAMHEGVVVAELIAGGHPHPVRPEAIAGCTYCAPQIASVGLTEAKAKEAGHEVRVGRFPFLGNGKAIALGDPEGLVEDGVRREDRRAARRAHDRAGGDRADPGLRDRPDAGDDRGRADRDGVPAPDAVGGDARGGARRLRADAALLNGQSGAASSTCSFTRTRPPKLSVSSRPARCAPLPARPARNSPSGVAAARKATASSRPPARSPSASARWPVPIGRTPAMRPETASRGAGAAAP